MMQLVPEMDDHRPELLAVNDTVLELGRCVGLSIIIVMNVYVGEDVGVQVWSLLVLTLTQVGTVLLCRGAMRSVKQGRAGGLNAGVFPHKQKHICQKRKSRWPQSTFRC